MTLPSSRMGKTCKSKKFFLSNFSRSCTLWFKNLILNWSLSFFQINSRLWMKCPMINIHHVLNILYISLNSPLISSICSNTKKLVAKSKDSSSKGSVFSKSQTTFSTSLPACPPWRGCFFKSFSAISQATYLVGFSGARNL